MNAAYINPFIQATQRIIQATCQENLSLCKVYKKSSPFQFGDVMIHIEMVNALQGNVFFVMNRAVACRLASKMMGDVPAAELTSMAMSAISELANMISGHVATDFSAMGIGVDISPPHVFLDGEMHVEHMECIDSLICVPLAFADGSVFEIEIYVK